MPVSLQKAPIFTMKAHIMLFLRSNVYDSISSHLQHFSSHTGLIRRLSITWWASCCIIKYVETLTDKLSNAAYVIPSLYHTPL